MSEAKHTPGPWHWFPREGSWQGSIEPDVCDFGDDTEYYPTEGTPPNETNARLIVAAPDLLEALERCLNFIENTESEMGDTLDCGDKARAAIARAKGGDT